MTSEKKWDLFLSHSAANSDLAERVKDDIESHVMDGRKITVWLDQTHIPFGGNITRYVNEGLSASAHIAVLMTPEYFRSASGWTDAEWHAALFMDPDNRSSVIIPILAEDCDVPVLLRPLKHVDIRGTHYSNGVKNLVRALTAKVSSANGSAPVVPSAEPDMTDERLYSNLFRFESFPSTFYQAVMSSRVFPRRGRVLEAGQIASRIRNEIASEVPPFQTYGDQIRAFARPEAPPFQRFVEKGTVRSYRTGSLDIPPPVRSQIVGLVNACIERHLLSNGIRRDPIQRDRFFYPMTHDDAASVVTWKPAKKTSRRTVAQPYSDKRTNQVVFWRHHAAYIRCIQAGKTFALEIEPTYVLTRDGREIMRGGNVGKVVSRWTAPERNFQIFYNVMFWRWTIGCEGEAIKSGATPIVLSDLPISFNMRRGILDDHRDFREDLADDPEATQVDFPDGDHTLNDDDVLDGTDEF